MPGHDPPVHILNSGVLIIVTSYKLHTRMVFWFDFNSERSYCGWFVDWWVWQRDDRCWCVLAKYGFGISTLQKLWAMMAFPSYRSYSFMNTPRDYNSLDGLTYLNLLIPTTGCGHLQNWICTYKKSHKLKKAVIFCHLNLIKNCLIPINYLDWLLTINNILK